MYDDYEKNKMIPRENSKYNEEELKEISEYLKDIFSDLSEDFHIKLHNSYRYTIGVNLIKKSPEFKKTDGSDDWSKFKQSTFKINEIIEQILTSKSYIESVDGEISDIWLHISKPNDAINYSFEYFLKLLKRKSDLGNLIQINIKYKL